MSVRFVASTFAITLAMLCFAGAAHAAGIVYVNRCAAGCAVFPGGDDATAQKSSLISTISGQSPFAHGDAVFNATVACLTRDLEPFDFTVVTNAPVVPHHQIMLAGHAAELGFPGKLGIAPRDAGLVRQNDIVFAFADDIGNDAATLCWVAARELGATYGLDSEYSCSDLMSYRQDCTIDSKRFTDVAAPCGEALQRDCDSGKPADQNSYQLFIARAGSNRLFTDGFEPPNCVPGAVTRAQFAALPAQAIDGQQICVPPSSFADTFGGTVNVCQSSMCQAGVPGCLAVLRAQAGNLTGSLASGSYSVDTPVQVDSLSLPLSDSIISCSLGISSTAGHIVPVYAAEPDLLSGAYINALSADPVNSLTTVLSGCGTLGVILNVILPIIEAQFTAVIELAASGPMQQAGVGQTICPK